MKWSRLVHEATKSRIENGWRQDSNQLIELARLVTNRLREFALVQKSVLLLYINRRTSQIETILALVSWSDGVWLKCWADMLSLMGIMPIIFQRAVSLGR